MRAISASLAPPTPISTSTPAEDFEREIVVKVNVPEVLRAELARPSWKREHVALGTNTDPYQWVESRYKLMPGIWEALRDSDTPGSLVTKSPLVLRDLELLQELNERGRDDASTCPCRRSTKRAWRETEPHTPSPRARIKAVAAAERGRRAGGRPDRAADAGHQRLAGGGREDRRARERSRRDQRRRGDAAPARRGARHLLRLVAACTGRT